MRVKGMNALFDVKFHVTVNDRTIVALATATGFFVAALPTPRPPKLQQAHKKTIQIHHKSSINCKHQYSIKQRKINKCIDIDAKAEEKAKKTIKF